MKFANRLVVEHIKNIIPSYLEVDTCHCAAVNDALIFQVSSVIPLMFTYGFEKPTPVAFIRIQYSIIQEADDGSLFTEIHFRIVEKCKIIRKHISEDETEIEVESENKVPEESTIEIESILVKFGNRVPNIGEIIDMGKPGNPQIMEILEILHAENYEEEGKMAGIALTVKCEPRSIKRYQLFMNNGAIHFVSVKAVETEENRIKDICDQTNINIDDIYCFKPADDKSDIIVLACRKCKATKNIFQSEWNSVKFTEDFVLIGECPNCGEKYD